MSASTPLYPNLQSSLNHSGRGSTSTAAEVRLSQSEEFGNADNNEFVFITDYNQVTTVCYYLFVKRVCLGRR